jgi:hypothetical protein
MGIGANLRFKKLPWIKKVPKPNLGVKSGKFDEDRG